MSKETLSTSEKEVPKIKLGLQDKYEAEKKEESHAIRLDQDNIKDVEDQLPEPNTPLSLIHISEPTRPY